MRILHPFDPFHSLRRHSPFKTVQDRSVLEGGARPLWGQTRPIFAYSRPVMANYPRLQPPHQPRGVTGLPGASNTSYPESTRICPFYHPTGGNLGGFGMIRGSLAVPHPTAPGASWTPSQPRPEASLRNGQRAYTPGKIPICLMLAHKTPTSGRFWRDFGYEGSLALASSCWAE